MINISVLMHGENQMDNVMQKCRKYKTKQKGINVEF